MTVYLDNSATTKPCKAAVEKAVEMMSENYANPSSLHALGFNAKKELDSARGAVASLLFCQPKDIYFTSGGTSADNIAILGAAYAKRREGSKIITTRLEHPAVLKAFEALEGEGFTAVYLEPDRNGKISLQDLENAVDSETVLVSVMAVNNEVGSVQDIGKIKQIIKSKGSGAYFHCDAVQAFGKIPLNPRRDGIDLMSVSAHKIHGIKGAGALYIAPSVKIKPTVFGGGQEQNLVSGTEAMPALCAFGSAVKALGNIQSNYEKTALLKQGFLEKLSQLDKVYVNSPEDAIPYIINISVEGVPSQVMLNSLSAEGICVSTGSACAKGHRSPVLTAMKIPPSRIDCAVRISLSRFTEEKEMDLLYNGICNAIKRVRR